MEIQNQKPADTPAEKAIGEMARFKKVMYYLGLSADEEYEQPVDEGFYYDEYEEEPAEPLEPIAPASPSYAASPVAPTSEAGFTPLSSNSSTVRLMPPPSKTKVQIITPHTFQEVKEIGDYLKNAQPIVVNLQETHQEVSRRIVDFSSGVCFALGGQMERVADLVYLLAPPDVEIDPEDRKRFQ